MVLTTTAPPRREYLDPEVAPGSLQGPRPVALYRNSYTPAGKSGCSLQAVMSLPTSCHS